MINLGPVKNVKVKSLFLFSLLGILLVISTPVVNSVLVNLISPTETVPMGNPSSAKVSVDPAQNVTDYEDPVYNVTIGSTVTFYINISGVADLFVWQINMSWDSAMLNVSRIIASEFLATSPNQTSSEALGIVINSTDNAIGSSVFAESILANVSGIGGSGDLVSVEFLIVGYGWTCLNISVGGVFPTLLLDSTGGTITYDRQLVPIFPSDGYFRNVLTGDLQADVVGTPPEGDVDRYDFWTFADAYGSNYGQPSYNHLADLQADVVGTPPEGDVDRYDFWTFADNYGRSTTIP